LHNAKNHNLLKVRIPLYELFSKLFISAFSYVMVTSLHHKPIEFIDFIYLYVFIEMYLIACLIDYFTNSKDFTRLDMNAMEFLRNTFNSLIFNYSLKVVRCFLPINPKQNRSYTQLCIRNGRGLHV